MKSKSRIEKKEIERRVWVVPEGITSKYGLMNWLLEKLGKQWNKISCKRALEILQLEDTPTNRHQWYDRKSAYKISLSKSGGGLKRLKPVFHAFNESSVFLGVGFRVRNTVRALDKGWVLTEARNRMIMWRERGGWLKWFETGRVRMHVRSPVTEGKILQLLANAFFNTGLMNDIREFTAFYRSFYLKRAKLTYDLGVTVPEFKIEFSDGFCRLIVTGGDRSHRKAIELDYLLLKEAEEHKLFLRDAKTSYDSVNEALVNLTAFLNKVMNNGMLPRTSSIDVPREDVVSVTELFKAKGTFTTEYVSVKLVG